MGREAVQGSVTAVRGEQHVPAWGAVLGSPCFGERFIAAHNMLMTASNCAL